MEIDDYIVATDGRLVELASEGDQQAFEYLFTRYSDALYPKLDVSNIVDLCHNPSSVFYVCLVSLYMHLKFYKNHVCCFWLFERRYYPNRQLHK